MSMLQMAAGASMLLCGASGCFSSLNEPRTPMPTETPPMVRAPGDDAGTPTTVTTVTTDDTISLTEATCKAGTIAHALSDTGCSAGEYCVNLSGSTGVCAVDYLSGFTCDDTLCGRIGAADADCYTVTVGVSTTAVCLFEAPL